MLNPFPDLLMYSFFAPTVLRVAVAVFLFYTAYAMFQQKANRAHRVGHIIFGLMLLLGLYTQIAALIGALGALAGIIFVHKIPHGMPRSMLVVLLAVCISLLMTGAGAMAFDIPL